MDEWIYEEDLNARNSLAAVNSVSLVRKGATIDEGKVLIWKLNGIGKGNGPNSPAIASVGRDLLVQVDNPNAPEILDRIRAVVDRLKSFGKV